MVDSKELDASIRNAAFTFLNEQQQIYGDRGLPRSVLMEGFTFAGQRVPLMGP